MKREMGFRFITLCLLCLVSPHADGARDLSTKNIQITTDEPAYVTNYGARESEAYITGYRAKKGVKEGVVDEPYMTGYRAKKGVKEGVVDESYITGYRAKKDVKEVELNDPYMTNYGAKGSVQEVETLEPYMTNYGAKKCVNEVEQSEAYMANYGGKKSVEVELSEPYMTNYGAKKNVKEVEPYMTNYGAKGNMKEEDEELYGAAPYVTQYGTKGGIHQMEGEEELVQLPHHHMHAHAHASPRNKAHEQGFFTLSDFHIGRVMLLNFPNQDHSPFLPRETADSLPFSTSQLPHLLQLFSIQRNSREAKHMKNTLEECEQEPIKGETKFCATSLESMTEFVHKIIGSGTGIRFNILSTILHPSTSTSITQKYTILKEPKQVIASNMVFCHPVPYPYAVFFCHHFESDTRFYQVSLLGAENGDMVEAVAVCHMDTSDWDPAHSLFRNLGIRPSASSPVCHFFPENHLVWIPSPTKAAS